MVPATILGDRGLFVLDSGATIHVLDDRYKPRLGNPVAKSIASTPGGRITVDLFASPDLRVRKLSAKSASPVVALDLAQLSEVTGHDIDGVLGTPFFLKHVISLNFDRGFVRFYEPNDYSPNPRGDVVSLHESKGMLYVRDIEIGGEKGSFLLDTGMNTPISLNRELFERLRLNGSISSMRTSQVATASGRIQGQSGKLKSIRMGPFEHHLVEVSKSTKNKIGLGYLRRFHVTIDGANKRMHLLKSASHLAADTEDTSGLHLLWVKNQIVVGLVDKHSPAHRAEIEVGDVLLELNGSKATGSNLFQLRNALRGNLGKDIQVTLLRDGRKRDTHFRLSDYANWNRVTDSAPR